MKNKELYDRTVDILVQSYFNDTLQSGNCYACGVGNLVAAAQGYEFTRTEEGLGRDLHWKGRENAYCNTEALSQVRSVTCIDDRLLWFDIVTGVVKQETDNVASTGYSARELGRLEKAFESCACRGDNIFMGLMNMIRELDAIHENKDEQIAAASRARFTKAVNI